MNNQISLHTCSKKTCLQVFLFTQIEQVLEMGYSLLQFSSHHQPLYFVVPSVEGIHSFKNYILEKQTHASFQKINTLKHVLQELLKKKGEEYQILDKTTLVVSLMKMMESKNERLFHVLNISKSSFGNDLFDVACGAAEEILWLDEHQPEILMQSAKELIDAISQQNPLAVFLHQAFELCQEYLDQMIWLGWPALPIYYLSKLKFSSSVILSLVPSRIFLSDIMTPKEKLKILKKIQGPQEGLDDNPLLAQTINIYKDFYNYLSEENIEVEFIENEYDSQTNLQRVQTFLYEAEIDCQFKQDETFFCVESPSRYQMAHQIYEQIYEGSMNSVINPKKWAIISDEPNKLASYLNAVAKSYKTSLNFSYSQQTNQIFQFIDFCLKKGLAKFSQDELLEALVILEDLYKDKLQGVFCHQMIQSLQDAHLIQNSKGKSGSFLLKVIQESNLRQSIFDCDDHEKPFEFNFLKQDPTENQDEYDSWHEELIDFIQKIESMAGVSCSIYEWCQKLRELLNHGLLNLFDVFPLKKTLLNFSAPFLNNKESISFYGFQNLLKNQFLESPKKNDYEIEIVSSEKIPFLTYDCVIFAGLKQKKPQQFQFLKIKEVLIKPKQYFCLWLLQITKKAVIFEGNFYENKDRSMPHEFIEIIMKMGIFNKKPDLTKLLLQKSIPNFLHNEIERLKASISLNSAESKRYQVELSSFISFTKDPESWLSKKLGIHQEKMFLDREIHRRHLLIWNLQQELNKGCSLKHAEEFDSFKKFEVQEQDAEFIRHMFAVKEDCLQNWQVKPALVIIFEDFGIIDIFGHSSEKKETWLAKQGDKLKLFCLLDDAMMS